MNLNSHRCIANTKESPQKRTPAKYKDKQQNSKTINLQSPLCESGITKRNSYKDILSGDTPQVSPKKYKVLNKRSRKEKEKEKERKRLEHETPTKLRSQTSRNSTPRFQDSKATTDAVDLLLDEILLFGVTTKNLKYAKSNKPKEVRHYECNCGGKTHVTYNKAVTQQRAFLALIGGIKRPIESYQGNCGAETPLQKITGAQKEPEEQSVHNFCYDLEQRNEFNPCGCEIPNCKAEAIIFDHLKCFCARFSATPGDYRKCLCCGKTRGSKEFKTINYNELREAKGDDFNFYKLKYSSNATLMQQCETCQSCTREEKRGCLNCKLARGFLEISLENEKKAFKNQKYQKQEEENFSQVKIGAQENTKQNFKQQTNLRLISRDKRVDPKTIQPLKLWDPQSKRYQLFNVVPEYLKAWANKSDSRSTQEQDCQTSPRMVKGMKIKVAKDLEAAITHMLAVKSKPENFSQNLTTEKSCGVVMRPFDLETVDQSGAFVPQPKIKVLDF